MREAPEAVDERAVVLSVFQHSGEGFAQRRRRQRQPRVTRNCRGLAEDRKSPLRPDTFLPLNLSEPDEMAARECFGNTVIGQGGTLIANSFTNLALGAAYTPLSLGPDGRIYTQNDGHLFILGQ